MLSPRTKIASALSALARRISAPPPGRDPESAGTARRATQDEGLVARSAPARETVLRARRLSVHGEAVIVDFLIEPSALHPWSTKRADQSFQQRVVAIAEECAKAVGKGYRLDSVEFGDAQLTVRLTGSDNLGDAVFLFALRPDISITREWLAKVDEAVENARRHLRDAIRDTDSTQSWFHRPKGATGAAMLVPRTDVTATWRTGTGVEVVEASPDPEAPNRALMEYRATLKQRESSLRSRASIVTITGIVFALVGLVAALATSDLIYTLGAAYGLMFVLGAFGLHQIANGSSDEIREIDQRLDLGGLLDLNEQRANKLFQVSSLELKRYYDQGRQQRKWIFAFGIVCILVGFGVVAAAFGLLYTDKDAEVSEKLITASLGAVGAVLANFVAVIYLRMFSSTLKSIVDFHNRLVITHHVNFGNVLAARITDRTLQDKTLAEMATALAHVGIDAAAPPAPVPDETSRTNAGQDTASR